MPPLVPCADDRSWPACVQRPEPLPPIKQEAEHTDTKVIVKGSFRRTRTVSVENEGWGEQRMKVETFEESFPEGGIWPESGNEKLVSTKFFPLKHEAVGRHGRRSPTWCARNPEVTHWSPGTAVASYQSQSPIFPRAIGPCDAPFQRNVAVPSM